jgi:hypothetical protein
VQDNRETYNPDWVIYKAPPTFHELATLNAGVILEPLVSDQPIEELGSFVTHGLANMSGHEVKKVIGEHTELGDKNGPSDEYRTLLARFKLIKCSVPPSALGDFGYPVAEVAEPAPIQSQPRTANEIYSKMLFGGVEKPNYEKIAVIVARNPHDPKTLTSLENLFVENGFDLNDLQKPELYKPFAVATAAALHHYIVKDPRTAAGKATIEQMGVDWTKSVGDSVTDVGRGIRIGVVKAIVDLADPAHTDPEFMAKVAINILDECDGLKNDLEGSKDFVRSIVRRIQRPVLIKLLGYSSGDFESIKHALGMAGHNLNVKTHTTRGKHDAIEIDYRTEGDSEAEAA